MEVEKMEEKQIKAFMFCWNDKQTEKENFYNFVKDFKGKFQVDKTGEIVEFTIDDIGKPIHLKTPIDFKNKKAVVKPFRGNVIAYILGKRYSFSVTLHNFFDKYTMLPVIEIYFANDFGISASDVT